MAFYESTYFSTRHKLFSFYYLCVSKARSESSLGGRKGRLGWTTKNPQAEFLRGYRCKFECKLFIMAHPERRK